MFKPTVLLELYIQLTKQASGFDCDVYQTVKSNLGFFFNQNSYKLQLF